jgi:hypothetical protein
MDTSTGSFTVCPTADSYKEQSSVQPTKLVLRTDGFMRQVQSFSVQRPTNCQGSVPSIPFALFTNAIIVRLSQGIRRLCGIIIVAWRGCIMARDKTFRVRLTQQEFEKLESNARQREISSAELVRDYIKRLPNLLNSGTSSPVVARGMSVYPVE